MKNFRKNNGITLIALVVTIVVLLILAGITISTLFGENGIISAARRADEDTRKDQINTEQGIKNLENDMNKVINGGLNASLIASEPSKYYGQKVNYIAGSETFQNELGVDWKIFYADSSHIYLIASDYVPISNLPYSTDVSGNVTTNKPTNPSSSYPKAALFDNTINDYAGSSRVASNLKYLNKSYFDYLDANNTSSTNPNMQAVAYMLDTKAWEGYKNEKGKAEFVIGGPTIEMLMDSYSKKNNLVNETGANKYQAKVTTTNSLNGYQISYDYGATWEYYTGINLSTSDSLYVISSLSNADGMWVASPSAYNTNTVMGVGANGYVNSYTYYGNYFGFRPVVSLKSNVVLEEQEDGSFNIK